MCLYVVHTVTVQKQFNTIVRTSDVQPSIRHDVMIDVFIFCFSEHAPVTKTTNTDGEKKSINSFCKRVAPTSAISTMVYFAQHRQRIFLFLSFVIFALSLTTTTALSQAVPGKKNKEYKGGAGVGRLVLGDQDQKSWKCKYDMVLVERIQKQMVEQSDTGLFVPQEDLPRLHLCRVMALGPGKEEENGSIAPMPEIAPGDIVIAKNPWGIGPKDEETTDGRKLSFMRAQDIAAVVTGGLVEEE